MQVAIKARCWDGERQKTLFEGKADGAEQLPEKCQEELRRWEIKLRSALGYTAPLVLASSFISFGAKASAHGLDTPIAMSASVSGAVKERILHAFDPLIDLAISLSYPIAGVMIAGGCLFVMVGNRERGMQMLQNAAIGYILVQLSPMFLNLLVGVGNTVS